MLNVIQKNLTAAKKLAGKTDKAEMIAYEKVLTELAKEVEREIRTVRTKAVELNYATDTTGKMTRRLTLKNDIDKTNVDAFLALSREFGFAGDPRMKAWVSESETKRFAWVKDA